MEHLLFHSYQRKCKRGKYNISIVLYSSPTGPRPPLVERYFSVSGEILPKEINFLKFFKLRPQFKSPSLWTPSWVTTVITYMENSFLSRRPSCRTPQVLSKLRKCLFRSRMIRSSWGWFWQYCVTMALEKQRDSVRKTHMCFRGMDGKHFNKK